MAKNGALSLFDKGKANTPAPLQRRGKMSEGIESRNYARIALKGQRFRPVVNGVTGKAFPEEEMQILIVDWAPALQRLYYEGTYDPASDSHDKPACFSDDNVKPHKAAAEPQSDKCASCPMNAIGSGQNGQGRACSMMRRLLVKVIGDDKRLYTLDLKAKSIFKSDQEEGYFCYQKYAQVLDEHSVDAMQVITGISFDEEESVPVLRFRPVEYPSAEEVQEAVRLYEELGKEEAARVLSLFIDGTTNGVSEEADGDREPTKPDLFARKPGAMKLSEQADPRTRKAPEPEEEEEPAPRKRRPAPEPEEEEEPAPRKRRPAPEPEEEEEPAPRKRRPAPEPEEEEEPAPRKRRPAPEPEEEEEPAPRKRRPAPEPEDADIVDEKPAKGKVEDDDGDDPMAAVRAKMRALGLDPDSLGK